MTIELREYGEVDTHLSTIIDVTDIHDDPDRKHVRKPAKAHIVGRLYSPGYTYTELTQQDNDGRFIIVFNEQTLEEFYLAHKLVIERTKQNGTD